MKNKKNIIIFAALFTIISGIFLFSKQKHKPKQISHSNTRNEIENLAMIQAQTEALSKNKQPATLHDSLIMPLDYLYATFSQFQNDPEIGKQASSLVSAYDKIKHELLYLDSISGLQIDFIGMVHNDWTTDDKEVLESQDSLNSLIYKIKWDIIGYENSDKFGFVNIYDLKNTMREEFEADGIDVSPETINQTIDENRRGDAIQRYIESGGKCVVGAECSEVWRLQQKMIFISETHDPTYIELLKRSRIALNNVRSAIAVSRVAKIMRLNKKKHAVVVYGRSHLADFIWIQKRFATKSNVYAL